MDVTCLRPFDFPEEYVFRPHRIGIVGNVMKCPPRSELMGTTYEQVAREADESSPWLMPNRILSQNVRRLGLSRFVRPVICNEDSWAKHVRALVEGDPKIPAGWHAIHWMNELWRTLAADDGKYRGRPFLDYIPDKDRPREGSFLARLYREHALLDIGPDGRSAGLSKPASIQSLPTMGTDRPATRQPPTADFPADAHVNILIPNMGLGGGERIVQETVQALVKRGAGGKVFLLHEASQGYKLDESGRVKVYRLAGLSPEAKWKKVSLEVLASPVPLVFTHMVKAASLAELWRLGVATIPVVHNARPSWQDDPRAFDHPMVPVVVAVSGAVAGQLREDGCPRPVVVIRHELQRWFPAGAMPANRERIRRQHGIPDDTLLIGMVGQFKSQKAYVRAVRVLAQIRRHHPAKLMILGGWDLGWGQGRTAYTATCRQAVELGVMPDLLTPGQVADPEPITPPSTSS